MAIPTFGPIRFTDLRSEFGGSNPVRASDYYRGGIRVPSSEQSTSKTYGSYSSYQYNPFAGTPKYYYERDGQTVRIMWNDSVVFSSTVMFDGGKHETGGYAYQRGSSQGNGFYSVRRRSYSNTTTTNQINQSVPQSGEISLNDLKGARDT